MPTIDGAVRPTLRRFPDWPRRLDDFIRERRSQPYVYGSNDCGGWILDWIRAATGVDLMPGFDRPRSARAAARYLLSRGHRDVEGMALEVLGAPLASARLAGRGDVVSFVSGFEGEGAGERHLAIVTGVLAVTPGRDGVLWVPRPLWVSGWRI